MSPLQIRNLTRLTVQEFSMVADFPAIVEGISPFGSMAEAWEFFARGNGDVMVFSMMVSLFEPFLDKEIRRAACAMVRTTPIGGGRVLWDLLADVRSAAAVITAEAYCRGEAGPDELAQACRHAQEAAGGCSRKAIAASAAAKCASDDWTAGGVMNDVLMVVREPHTVPALEHCRRLLAEGVPNPFVRTDAVFPVMV